jgi:hypothetical protein
MVSWPHAREKSALITRSWNVGAREKGISIFKRLQEGPRQPALLQRQFLPEKKNMEGLGRIYMAQLEQMSGFRWV